MFSSHDMKVQDRVLSVSTVLVVLFLGIFTDSRAHGRLLSIPKPDKDAAVATARWLVSENTWGALSTISSEMGGAPFAKVVSFSDGLPKKGSGTPYFYLTTLDPIARDALQDPRASFALSEYPLGTCNRDPMDPTCAKLTLTGKLLLVDAKSEEAEVAQTALFAKHPEMKYWPRDHGFRFFKLEIQDIFLVNWYGGAKNVTVDEYLHPKNKLASAL